MFINHSPDMGHRYPEPRPEAELLKEAFMTSANPMGTFLLTNFPTPSSVPCRRLARSRLRRCALVASQLGFCQSFFWDLTGFNDLRREIGCV